MSIEQSLPVRKARRLGMKDAGRPRFVILLCMVWLMLVLLVAAGADHLAPFSYTEQSLLNRLKPPAFLSGDPKYLLGTDGLGRDVLSRLIYATRMSVVIAILGSMIGATFGTLLGFLAAHFRGLIEDVVMVFVDFQASMPFFIIALAVLAFFGNNFELFLVVVGLYGWEVYARLTRGLVLQANGQGYAFAIRTLGVHPARIYMRHILPNILSVLIVQLTLNFPELILIETSLSFLGLGIQPPQTSLGLMLGEGRNYLATAWWTGVPAGIVIFLTTLSISLVGDWLRDKLDPTLKSAEI
ncbi:peptide/nickel transport system permease protein [Xaviernesmea oryzae]|uniref:Peptide/nickel transport system permease protein n=1 Tax=Xaviernesmea oryzae TaxID=464029 RepID=A0A1X7FUB5_9HYPH|nr:ABC transporter permease [Xaviernesmea oryzae]SMF58923.1 peptide/nickel transport system permease protein [Xaviernesmea oryzae]